MPKPQSPHDALFKAAFGQPDLARSELEFVLPPAVRTHLDLATLEVCPGSFVDDELRHAHTDLLYRTRTRSGAEVLVYVLFEHQSTFDPRMPLRLLRYVVGVWEAWEREHPGLKLPVVIPVVLSHDPGGWLAPPEFASMLDASPDVLAAMRPYLPLFRFVLDDLEAVSLDALAARRLHALALLVELAFWSARSLSRLESAAPHMSAIIQKSGRDDRARSLLRQLYAYLLRDGPQEVEVTQVRAILERIAGEEGKEDVMNAGDQLIAQGHAKGLVDGLRTAVATVLSVRGLSLSEAGRAKLASCTDADVLTRWHARAVTARAEDEVFAGEG
jgi:predicted transposase/invertase (TIGR01784 family)